MTTESTPQSYEEWRHCIIVKCGLELTPDYISERLSALNNNDDYQTKRFIVLYGEHYLQRVIEWFRRAEKNE